MCSRRAAWAYVHGRALRNVLLYRFLVAQLRCERESSPSTLLQYVKAMASTPATRCVLEIGGFVMDDARRMRRGCGDSHPNEVGHLVATKKTKTT